MTTQSSALLQGEGYPAARWARDVRPPSPLREQGTYSGGLDGDEEDIGYAGNQRYEDGPQAPGVQASENPFQDTVDSQEEPRDEDPEFSYERYSDQPRPP
jgi:hypothetical protein